MTQNEVFRQAAKSQIIVNAHRINQGAFPDLRKPESESVSIRAGWEHTVSR